VNTVTNLRVPLKPRFTRSNLQRGRIHITDYNLTIHRHLVNNSSKKFGSHLLPLLLVHSYALQLKMEVLLQMAGYEFARMTSTHLEAPS
jgi:hypothetical protein